MIKEKKKKEKREVEVKVRMTAKEKEELKKLAKEEGLTISQYIRKQALKKQGKKETREIKELKYEIRKIGVNINQMAWALNVLKTREKIGDKVFLEIKARIEKSLNQLEEVTKKCLST